MREEPFQTFLNRVWGSASTILIRSMTVVLPRYVSVLTEGYQKYPVNYNYGTRIL